jgi:16S rRNA (guanine1207-N2)-methyltransferase
MEKDCAMPDHYYTPEPSSAHKPAHIGFAYRGHALAFQTDSGVFSRLEVDKGTEILLSALPEKLSGAVLDMGCGYGVIGVSIGKAYPGVTVTMADINGRAVELALANATQNGVSVRTMQSDGYAAFPMERSFDLILQNPPIRAGKTVIYTMFAEGARRLLPGGALWIVIRKQQGAPSAMNYLRTLFERVEAMEKKSGYWVLRCEEPVESAGEAR